MNLKCQTLISYLSVGILHTREPLQGSIVQIKNENVPQQGRSEMNGISISAVFGLPYKELPADLQHLGQKPTGLLHAEQREMKEAKQARTDLILIKASLHYFYHCAGSGHSFLVRSV